MQLSEGSSGHIPYRDSKLTRLLQYSLSGKARICVVRSAHLCVFHLCVCAPDTKENGMSHTAS